MDSEQMRGLPVAMYQLAEQHQAGQPLALYNTHVFMLRLIRLYKIICYIAITACIFAFVAEFITLLLSVTQLQILHSHDPLEEQRIYLQNIVINNLFPLVLSLIVGIGIVVNIRMVARYFPTSILACTEGLLMICPKEVEVTRWDEITSILSIPGITRRKSYMLSRINRKPLTLGTALEDVEGLIDLIKQHIEA